MTDSSVVYGRLPPGTVIANRYRLGEIVGKGGTGLIYEAVDLTNNQTVAVKTLNADLLSHPTAVARYHVEAQAAANIGHPNICAVLDVGQLQDQRPFLVMELLTGRTLADLIRDDGPMDFSQVFSILTQTLSALEAAHGKKIVHRDIKPENVFLMDRIRGVLAVKLLDFGIAKSLDENSELDLTRTGMVVGTPYYMAPEQARGEELDHRVDIYSCGVMLFEMLTAERPFEGANYNALMVQVLTKPPPDPCSIRPDIPSGFASIVFKAMSKDKRDRYSTAGAFLADLWELQQAVSAQNHRPKDLPQALSVSAEIPVFHEVEQVPVALGLVRNMDDDAVTRPVERPAHLQKKPPLPPRYMDSMTDITEVMLEAPWLLEENQNLDDIDDIPVTLRTEERSTSWDDEPTRVDAPVEETPKEFKPRHPPQPVIANAPRKVPRPKPKS